MVENPRSFAEQCEQIAAGVLSPFAAAAGRIMQWLENVPSIVPRSSRELDPARGEQLAVRPGSGHADRRAHRRFFFSSLTGSSQLSADFRKPPPPDLGPGRSDCQRTSSALSAVATKIASSDMRRGAGDGPSSYVWRKRRRCPR